MVLEQNQNPRVETSRILPISVFSSAPSALWWCKALVVIPVIWISVSRSGLGTSQSQHDYRCGLWSDGTEVSLTWFQLYDLHSSQLPSFYVSSLKDTTVEGQNRNLDLPDPIFLQERLWLYKIITTLQCVDGVNASRNSCLVPIFQNQHENCETWF